LSPPGGLAQSHQRQVGHPPFTQPVGGRKGALAASATEHNASPRHWLPDKRIDSLDADAARAGEGRLRRFIEAAEELGRISLIRRCCVGATPLSHFFLSLNSPTDSTRLNGSNQATPELIFHSTDSLTSKSARSVAN